MKNQTELLTAALERMEVLYKHQKLVQIGRGWVASYLADITKGSVEISAKIPRYGHFVDKVGKRHACYLIAFEFNQITKNVNAVVLRSGTDFDELLCVITPKAFKSDTGKGIIVPSINMVEDKYLKLLKS